MFMVEVPQYIEPIITMLCEEDWLTHSFDVQGRDIYNVSGYLCNNKMDGVEYVVIIDSNLLQFMINAVKREGGNSKQRAAIGFIVFCQIANIDIDPTYACYEKSFRSDGGAAEAADYLSIFNCLNSADNKNLAEFALGYSDSIDIGNDFLTDRQDVISKLTKYKQLKDWRCLYLMVLKIVHLKYYKNAKTPEDSISEFFQWCYDTYRFSISASIFAVILFGNSPIRNMMKFKKNKTKLEKIGALENMTWDLYIMSKFFRSWVEPDYVNKEYLLASDDKPFTEIIRTVIKIQSNFDSLFSYLSSQISGETIKFLANIERMRQLNTDFIGRVYGSEKWNPDYRDKLISEFENAIL